MQEINPKHPEVFFVPELDFKAAEGIAIVWRGVEVVFWLQRVDVLVDLKLNWLESSLNWVWAHGQDVLKSIECAASTDLLQNPVVVISQQVAYGGASVSEDLTHFWNVGNSVVRHSVYFYLPVERAGYTVTHKITGQ